jgi:hypothetical protein
MRPLASAQCLGWPRPPGEPRMPVEGARSGCPGGCEMRCVWIGSGILILSVAGWVATAQALPPGAVPLYGQLGLNGLDVTVRPPLTGAPEHLGLFSAQPQAVGGPGPMMTEHLVSPAVQPVAHFGAHAQPAGTATPQPPAAEGAAAAGTVGLDQSGAVSASAQPNPTAGPAAPRPPGAAGPGVRLSGWSGPGLPGPGRPANPR